MRERIKKLYRQGFKAAAIARMIGLTEAQVEMEISRKAHKNKMVDPTPEEIKQRTQEIRKTW